jgi:hypothetical protein
MIPTSHMALSSPLVGTVPINLLSFPLFSVVPVLSHLLSCGRPVVSTLNTHQIRTTPATPPHILPLSLLPDWPGNLSRQPITLYIIPTHPLTSINSWYFAWTFFNTMFSQNIRLQLSTDAASYSRRQKPSVVTNTHPKQKWLTCSWSFSGLKYYFFCYYQNIILSFSHNLLPVPQMLSYMFHDVQQAQQPISSTPHQTWF